MLKQNEKQTTTKQQINNNMATEKELLLAFLSKSLNLDNDGVASLIYNEDGSELKADALTTLLDKQQKFVKKWKDDSSKFDQGYNKGKSESLSAFEKSFKDKFEFESEKSGVELIEEYVESVRAKAGTKEITDDDVKKHKLFLDRDAQYRADLKKAKDDAAAELNKVQATYKQEKTFAEVQKKALEILDSKKPILSSDATKAQRQKLLLLNDLKGFTFDIQGEGDDARIVVMKDGKVYEDNLGHAIEFDTLVNEKSDLYYDFEAADNRSAAGNPNNKGVGAAGGHANQGQKGGIRTLHGMTLKKPSSDREYAETYLKINSDAALKPEQRSELNIALGELWNDGKS